MLGGCVVLGVGWAGDGADPAAEPEPSSAQPARTTASNTAADSTERADRPAPAGVLPERAVVAEVIVTG
ncbi:hypothetical protein SAMN04488563_5357 [Jiangella alkaliphila]|uniref:Uncharacterized protein n=1 Tax=Jiangella alkaliphila TaxID=419479 RepID=A0A1H2L864_9ACTN|nr:hypothetical protein SAMN04488563_5357 [Jiangella alkaliphila]